MDYQTAIAELEMVIKWQKTRINSINAEIKILNYRLFHAANNEIRLNIQKKIIVKNFEFCDATANLQAKLRCLKEYHERAKLFKNGKKH